MALYSMEPGGNHGGTHAAMPVLETLGTVLLIGLIHAGLLLLADWKATTSSFPSATPTQSLAVRWLETPSQPLVGEFSSARAVEPQQPPPAKPEPKPERTERKPPTREPQPEKKKRKPMLASRDRVARRSTSVQALAETTSESQTSAQEPAASDPAQARKGGETSQVVTPPRVDAAYLANPAPEYPPTALRARQQGKVLLRVLVGADGCPRTVKVEHGCGHSMLDSAAVAAVRRWKFIPGRRGGVAVDGWVLVPILFKLRS